jgi:hypothetical protein
MSGNRFNPNNGKLQSGLSRLEELKLEIQEIIDKCRQYKIGEFENLPVSFSTNEISFTYKHESYDDGLTSLYVSYQKMNIDKICHPLVVEYFEEYYSIVISSCERDVKFPCFVEYEEWDYIDNSSGGLKKIKRKRRSQFEELLIHGIIYTCKDKSIIIRLKSLFEELIQLTKQNE